MRASYTKISVLWAGPANGTDEAEWQSPANKRLCDEANDRRNEQVHEKVEAERPYMTAKLNGDTICQDEVQS